MLSLFLLNEEEIADFASGTVNGSGATKTGSGAEVARAGGASERAVEVCRKCGTSQVITGSQCSLENFREVFEGSKDALENVGEIL